MVLAAEIAYLAQQPELRLEDDLDIGFGLSMEYLAKLFGFILDLRWFCRASQAIGV